MTDFGVVADVGASVGAGAGAGVGIGVGVGDGIAVVVVILVVVLGLFVTVTAVVVGDITAAVVLRALGANVTEVTTAVVAICDMGLVVETPGPCLPLLPLTAAVGFCVGDAVGAGARERTVPEMYPCTG